MLDKLIILILTPWTSIKISYVNAQYDKQYVINDPELLKMSPDSFIGSIPKRMGAGSDTGGNMRL